MAGIYIHIPFCKQACHYCDFHFSTSLKYKEQMVQAICKEIELRKIELAEPVESIYFGGGTPSLLNKEEIERIFDAFYSHFDCSEVKEISLEANPDDITTDKLKELASTPINRLSIGIQSFYDQDLQWMNRSHNAKQAKDSIMQAQDIGFENLTIDLIYGSPTTSDENWLKNLEQWKELSIPHLSAYCLTVEEKTALYKQEQSKPQVNNEQGSRQLDLLMAFASQNAITHYEISNFCVEDHFAIHNTNYWFNRPYLGIGPSAHSFNGKAKRKWNISNNIQYIQSIKEGILPTETEFLSKENQINEYILTRLRTKWGIEKKEFIQRFSQQSWNQIESVLKKYAISNHISEKNNQFVLTNSGRHLADKIAADCFV